MNEKSLEQQRADFSVGEDPNLIFIADACLESKVQSVKDRITAALQGDAFVLSLPEDFGIFARLVVGQLTSDEQEAWVARASRSINLDTGRLVVDGGGFFGREPDPQVTQTVDYAIFEVPPGRYTLTCYVYLHSDLATDMFRRRKLSYIELFQRSHPSEQIPNWLFELAEGRDNDFEEEQLETLDEATLDDSHDENLIEYVLQLQPVDRGTQDSELSAKGKLKWEKRWPKSFPTPLRSADHSRSSGAKDLTKAIVDSFVREDFETASNFFARSLRPLIGDFFADMFAAISQKMPVPTRKRPSESCASVSDWLDKMGHPHARVDTRSIQQNHFVGSTAVRLVSDVRDRHDTSSVDFEFAFVKTDAGIRAAGVKMSWSAPVRRKPRNRVLSGPACPKCSQRLASELAKQCIHCGVSWH